MTLGGIPLLSASIYAEEEDPPVGPTPIFPGTPSITVTTPSGLNGVLDVTWAATTSAIGYELRHDDVNPPTFVTNINAVSPQRVTGLTGLTVYYIQVRAKSSTGDYSAWSTTQTGTPTAGTPPPSGGLTYPFDPVWNVRYSGTSPSFNPSNPAVSGSGRFTYTSGSWESAGTRPQPRREPTPGDEASITFTKAGANITLEAGRIDQTDRNEMDDDDIAFDGALNNAGSGFDGRPKAKNCIISGGVVLKDGPFDPAVFPGTDGPHRHSITAVANSYWNTTTLKGGLGGQPDPAIDLNRTFVENALFKTVNGGQWNSGMMMFWPTFVDGVALNGARNSGYIGRPRPVTGFRDLPLYTGNDMVPFPQGLRMATFKCNFFKSDGYWEFVAVLPNCWDGIHEWLPNNAHVSFLQANGTPPNSHPFVIPQIHWFVSTLAPLTLSASQVKERQSSQVTNGPLTPGPGGINPGDPSYNPGEIFFGQRRDYWNYNNTYVPLHAEIVLCMDPTLSEAICWMVNNWCGLGRIRQV